MGMQQFRAVILGTEYHYDRFTELNHSEYTLDGAWNWKLGRALDGLLEVTRVRSMVSLYNLIQAGLALRGAQTGTVPIANAALPTNAGEAVEWNRTEALQLFGALQDNKAVPAGLLSGTSVG